MRLSPHAAQAAQTPLSQDAVGEHLLSNLHDTTLKTTPIPLFSGYAGSRQQLLGCSLFYEFLFQCHHQLSRDERPGGSLPAFAWGDVPLQQPSRRCPQVQPLPAPLQSNLRFLRHPLPAVLSASLTVRLPSGRTTGLPRSARVPAWVRPLLYTGGAPSAIDAR